ncbi:hypothetical protein BC830DRAFT_219664 [Chytriomyces sp. MP71]|nr:hypothetical protein BC830DRAFT_219664 [Chytriomyces sp. MP71]
MNAGFAMTASKVFGYNLEFAVHTRGCVLVTGASGRIGAHAARTLVSMGFTVFAGVESAVHGRKLAQKCARDARAERNTGAGSVIPLVLDVTDPVSLRAAYETVCGVVGVALDSVGPGGKVVRTPEAKVTKVTATFPAPMSPLPSTGKMLRGSSRLADTPLTYSDSDDEIENMLPNVKASSSVTSSTNDLVPENVASEDLFIGIINCEGTESPGALEVVPLQEIMRCYEVNTAGAVAVTQCFLPLLRESKGRIINVCSSVGITAAPINGSYAASKMALIAVSESLRVELYPFGISVSIIEPGSLDASSWSPKKKETAPAHSLQLGSSPIQREDESASLSAAPAPISPVNPQVTRSRSRSQMRMSAPPTTLTSLKEDDEDEVPYVAPAKKIVSRRGSGSVDENNRASSPQVYGILSPPTSPIIVPSSIPLPVKPRRSMSSMSSHMAPRPQSVQQMRTRRASTTDPRLDRARPSTSLGQNSSAITVNSSAVQHPTWDATDRAQVAQKLYGPLIDAVRDMSDAAADRVREEEYQERASARDPTRRRSLINSLTASLSPSANMESPNYAAPAARRARGQSVGPLLTQTGTVQRMVDMGVVDESDVVKALTSSCRHVSRAIVHGLTSPFPKTRYRVGWDARATAALRWALPDRFLDWGFVALSGRSSSSAGSASTSGAAR